MSEPVAEWLAANLKSLRASRGLSQRQLADRAGIPRATLAQLESGGANPTLSVLLKVSGALGVPVQEVLDEPRVVMRHYPVASLPTTARGKVTIRKLLPDPLPGLALERLELRAGARLDQRAASASLRRYLICEAGELEVEAFGSKLKIRTGELVLLKGDHSHVLFNRGRKTAVALGVTETTVGVEG